MLYTCARIYKEVVMRESTFKEMKILLYFLKSKDYHIYIQTSTLKECENEQHS